MPEIHHTDAECPRLRFLGYANGWRQEPPAVARCRELGHVAHQTQLHGKTEASCPQCGYYYYIDESD